MSSEIYSHLYEQILAQGALDMYTESIYMKKNRPAYCLTLLCQEDQVDVMKDILFKETTTIAIRYHLEKKGQR